MVTNIPIITNRQLRNIVLVLIFTTSILFVPGFAVTQSGNGGWIVPVLAFIYVMIIITIMVKLYMNHPKQSLAQNAIAILGRNFGTAIGLLYGLFFWFTGFLVIKEIVSLICCLLLPHTPMLATYLLILIPIAYSLYAGLETIARVTELLTLILMVTFILFVVGLIGTIHISAFFPLFDKGWAGVLRGAYIPSMWYGEIILVSFLFPFLSEQQHLTRGVVMGLAVTTVLLMFVLVMDIGVLGASDAARIHFSTLEVIRYEQWGEFFQHLDVLFLLPWLLLMFMKASILCLAGQLAFAQVLPVSNPHLLIIPMLLLSVTTMSWLFPDEVSFSQFLGTIFPVCSMVFGFLMPLSLLLVDTFRRNMPQGNRARGSC